MKRDCCKGLEGISDVCIEIFKMQKGLENDSLGKVLVAQARGPEFGYLVSM